VEWLTDDGLFSIDIAFSVNGTPVALEVDGAHHYTNSKPLRPLSDVAIRRRLLQHRGWTVVNLGYTEWEALQSNAGGSHPKLLEALAGMVGQELGVDRGAIDWQTVDLPVRSEDSIIAQSNGVDAALLNQHMAAAAAAAAGYDMASLAAVAASSAMLQDQGLAGGMVVPWDLQQSLNMAAAGGWNAAAADLWSLQQQQQLLQAQQQQLDLLQAQSATYDVLGWMQASLGATGVTGGTGVTQLGDAGDMAQLPGARHGAVGSGRASSGDGGSQHRSPKSDASSEHTAWVAGNGFQQQQQQQQQAAGLSGLASSAALDQSLYNSNDVALHVGGGMGALQGWGNIWGSQATASGAGW
jgi:hypothetical protein